ncbi:hypothetical protein CDD83_7629 [Cordyceps sp. RAO-2017]|nr:hypothetical protein CDD83_7629 [Cordyceps sp. RAO-2017]
MTVASSSRVPRGDVTAPLSYYQGLVDEASQPFYWVDQPPEGQPQRNFTDVTHETRIRDIRGREADFSLDRDAFEIVPASRVPPSRETEFVDDDAIRRNYYPEVERLLLDTVAGADRVYLFDHTIRRPGTSRVPVTRVHIDQTADSVATRVRRYYPDEADALLRRRYRIVNVWRPLNAGPVESFPLSFASTASLDAKDVIPIEHRYPDGYRGQTAAIKFNPAQQWYYLSGMTPDERLLLECFDSESLKPGSKIGGRVPHTAFADPRTLPDAEGRESIEVRALVFGS